MALPGWPVGCCAVARPRCPRFPPPAKSRFLRRCQMTNKERVFRLRARFEKPPSRLTESAPRAFPSFPDIFASHHPLHFCPRRGGTARPHGTPFVSPTDARAPCAGLPWPCPAIQPGRPPPCDGPAVRIRSTLTPTGVLDSRETVGPFRKSAEEGNLAAQNLTVPGRRKQAGLALPLVADVPRPLEWVFGRGVWVGAELGNAPALHTIGKRFPHVPPPGRLDTRPFPTAPGPPGCGRRSSVATPGDRPARKN